MARKIDEYCSHAIKEIVQALIASERRTPMRQGTGSPES